MKAYFGLLMVLAWTFCLPVNAQIYQYRDKQGQLRFTDDYYAVPVEQRPAQPDESVRLVKPEATEAEPAAAESSVPPPAAPAAAPEVSKPLETQPESEVASTGSQPAPETAPAAQKPETPASAGAGSDSAPSALNADTLEARNQELKKEFQTLMEEKERLEAARKNVRDKAQERGLEAEIVAFNQKVEQYEQRRGVLNKDVDTYNNAMQQAETQKKPGKP